MKKILFALLILFNTSIVQAAIPSISCIPSRTSGVAPLFVFQDCTGTTDVDTVNPFHDLYYEHNFGDQVAGSVGLWGYGSNIGDSKNFATGAITAHIYETPGTYTLTTRVWDGITWVTSTNSITVSSADSIFHTINTICISANTDPIPGSGGCPTGAAHYQQSNFITILSSYATTGKRVLLKRGDSFTANTTGTLIHTGPGIIGAYGIGAKPLITQTGGVNTITYNASGNADYTFGDWRLMDLHLDGNLNAGSIGVGTSNSAGIIQFTLLRIDFTNFDVAIGISAEGINVNNNNNSRSHTLDQIAIQDCTVTYGSNTWYAAYMQLKRSAVLGSSFDTGALTNRTHTMRILFADKLVIAHNNIMHPGFTRHAIKMHGPTFIAGVPDPTFAAGSYYSEAFNGDGYTKYVQIQDNYFESGNDYAWLIAISPEDSGSDQRLRDIIYERNVTSGNAYTLAAITIAAQKVTLRNNVMYGSTSNEHMFALLRIDGLEPPASNLWIYNNTLYTAHAVPNGQFYMIDIHNAGLSNIILLNNLAYAPNSTSPVFRLDAGASNVIISNNSSDIQIKNTNPLFEGTTSATGFRLNASSYATTSGVHIFPATQRDLYNCIDKSVNNYRLGAMVPKSNARCFRGR